MRKTLLYFLGASLLLFVIVMGAKYSVRVEHENPDSLTDAENKEEKKIAQTTPEVASFPLYAGQPVYFLGNDPTWQQLPTDAAAKQKQYLAQLAETLKENPNDFDGWMAVGIHKKFFNNYEGARDAWEYAKLLVPEQQVPYLNLANLYAYYLNDRAKAEANYLAAAELDLSNIYGSYTALAGFYRDFGFSDAALAWYQKALEFNPGDPAILTEIEYLQSAK